jgi:hypothetical protein
LDVFGIKLERSHDKRRHLYGAFPDPSISSLLPDITFKSIDPSKFTTVNLRQSVVQQEKFYEKFKEIKLHIAANGGKKRQRGAVSSGSGKRSTVIKCFENI